MNQHIQQQLREQLETIQTKTQPVSASSKQVTINSISETEQAIITEADIALKNWKASEEGQAIQQQLSSCDVGQLKALAPKILHSHHFDKTIELIQQQTAAKSLDVSFPIKSIAIGLFGEIDFIAGLVASVGYALDIADFGQTAAVYVGGGVVEGLSEGLVGGVELTLWRNETSDLQGYYNCQEISGGFGLDFDGVAYEQDESLAGISVGVDLGEQEGLDEWEYYMITFATDHYPVYQAGDAQHFLILGDLVCVKMNDLTGHDEVSLTFRPDSGLTYRYPTWDSYSMSEDSGDSDHTWNLGRSIKYNSYIDIFLSVGANDLPSVRVNYSDFGNNSTVTKTFYRDGSISNGWNEIKYTLQIQTVY